MRNLAVYPITHAEKMEVLDRCARLLKEDIGNRIGGVQMFALREIREQVEASAPDEA